MNNELKWCNLLNCPCKLSDEQTCEHCKENAPEKCEYKTTKESFSLRCNNCGSDDVITITTYENYHPFTKFKCCNCGNKSTIDSSSHNGLCQETKNFIPYH